MTAKELDVVCVISDKEMVGRDDIVPGGGAMDTEDGGDIEDPKRVDDSCRLLEVSFWLEHDIVGEAD